jgi:hypothetical protein
MSEPVETGENRKIGFAWGDDISEERQRELNAILATWEAEADRGDRKRPFDVRGVALWSRDGDASWIQFKRKDLTLTGADVSWLAARRMARAGHSEGDATDAEVVAEQIDRLREWSSRGVL